MALFRILLAAIQLILLRCFTCPEECLECFHTESRGKNVFHGGGRSRFLCVVPSWEAERRSAMPRKHTCGPFRRVLNHAHQSAAFCDFTKKELSEGAQLPREPTSFTSKTFGEIVFNEHHCTLMISKADSIGIIGNAVDTMLFTLNTSHRWYTGINAAQKALFRRFASDGVCSKPSKMSTICNQNDRDCLRRQTDALCRRMMDDMSTGKLDKAVMGMWGAAVGPLEKKERFDLPTSKPKLLQHLAIPGWSSKFVTLDNLDDQPEMPHGPFWCVMERLQGMAVEDATPEKPNQFDDRMNGLRSRSILDEYFKSFYYPDPFHFVIADEELQTDATLAKLVFESIGAHRVEVIDHRKDCLLGLSPFEITALPTAPVSDILRQLPTEVQKQAHFVVRLDSIFENMKAGLVRAGMERWGGNAFFNGVGELLALQYNGETVLPSDSKWARFKFIFRSSLVSMVTAFDHLVSAHIITSQSLAMAAFETLPADHGLRILLAPHLWNALNINLAAAANLFAPMMLVHRASPYTVEAFGNVRPSQKGNTDGAIWSKAAVLRYQTFAETYNTYEKSKKDRMDDGFPELPYFEDGILLYRALKRYFTNFVKLQYGSDWKHCNEELRKDSDASRFIRRFFYYTEIGTETFWPDKFHLRVGVEQDCRKLADLLTEMIFVVTGFHSQVGVVTDYFRDTSFVSTAWMKNEAEARPKHSLLMMTLASTTTCDHPRMNQSLCDIYSNDEQIPVTRLFKGLHEELQTMQRIVESRNKVRLSKGHLEYHLMEPQYLLWGVSV